MINFYSFFGYGIDYSRFIAGNFIAIVRKIIAIFKTIIIVKIIDAIIEGNAKILVNYLRKNSYYMLK